MEHLCKVKNALSETLTSLSNDRYLLRSKKKSGNKKWQQATNSLNVCCVMKLPIAAVKFYIRDQDFNLAMEH